LNINKENYKNYNFENFGEILQASEYIELIKNDSFWMGELEICTFVEIYNVSLIVFNLENNLKRKKYMKLIEKRK
jgi:hypothetical protein